MKGMALDPRGHIYEGTEEKPVTPEDEARLHGYLKAKAEADSEDFLKEKLRKIEQREARLRPTSP